MIMIRHILKIIWNERKANAWIVVEYVVVFCILWFCVDYLSFIAKGLSEPIGVDIEHTYQIRMQKKAVKNTEDTDSAESRMDNYEMAKLFVTRVKNYPGVESVCFSHQGIPYGGSTSHSSFFYGPDSLVIGARSRWVTSEYFDVYKIPLISGRFFNSDDVGEEKNVIISSDRNGLFKGWHTPDIKVSEVRTLLQGRNDYIVTGITKPVKDAFYKPYENSIYLPLAREKIDLRHSQISMRVSPNAGNDFAQKFMTEMREQLNIGPYFLASITSAKKLRKDAMDGEEIPNSLNSIYSVTAFLVINIFLGVIGTFWYRTQARRNEIGLRISLGASKKKVKSMIYTETLLLLFIASIIAVNICINIAQTDFLEAIDMPVANREYVGSGIEQDFLNYGLTFLFLALVSLFAVWYPTRQASDIPPAEALREE